MPHVRSRDGRIRRALRLTRAAAEELVVAGWAEDADEVVRQAVTTVPSDVARNEVRVAKVVEQAVRLAAWRARVLQALEREAELLVGAAPAIERPDLADLLGPGAVWAAGVSALAGACWAAVRNTMAGPRLERRARTLPWRLRDRASRPVEGRVDDARLADLRRERDELWRLRREAAWVNSWADSTLREFLGWILAVQGGQLHNVVDRVAELAAVEREIEAREIEMAGEVEKPRPARRRKKQEQVEQEQVEQEREQLEQDSCGSEHAAPVTVTRAEVESGREELRKLSERERELRAMVKAARLLGDLSENGDYQTAREELARVRERRRQLERQLSTWMSVVLWAVVDEVRVLARVDGGEPEEIVVGVTAGTDPSGAMRVSAVSPVGRAILDAVATGRTEVDVVGAGERVRIEIDEVLRRDPGAA